MDPYKPAPEPSKAVSLGGNGTRGLSGLLILEGVIERLRASKNSVAIPVPSEVFSMIGGTLTAQIKKTLTIDDPPHQEPTAGSSDSEPADDLISLLEHVVAKDEKTLPIDDLSRLKLQHALATVYLKDNQVSKAIPILEHVVAIRSKYWTPDYPQLLRSQYFLAQAYYANGQIEIATRLLQSVVEIERASMRENHQYRIDSERLLQTWASMSPRVTAFLG